VDGNLGHHLHLLHPPLPGVQKEKQQHASVTVWQFASGRPGDLSKEFALFRVCGISGLVVQTRV